jgi:hypothetical protein
MNAKTIRKDNQSECVIGDFSVNGFPLCNSLEPPYGYKNSMGYQAIEPGIRDMVLYFSPEFGCVLYKMTMDEITGVDESSRYLEIHWGNSSEQPNPKTGEIEAVTKGCTCLGIKSETIENWISNSQANWKNFMEKYGLPARRNEAIALLAQNKDHLSAMGQWELKILHQLQPQSDEKCTYEIINNF